MKQLVPDYELPSYTDLNVSETELRAAVQVLTDTIQDLRHVRNNYEEILTKRFVEGLFNGHRPDNIKRSKPWNSDLRETYERRERRPKRW